MLPNDSTAASLLGVIHGFRRSKTVFAALELGIFDGCRPTVRDLPRLLDACVSLGLLARSGDIYTNTEIADRYLRQSSPETLAGYIRYLNRSVYHLWAHLEEAILEGSDGWKAAFGDDSAQVRDATFRAADFISGMHAIGIMSSATIVRAFDLSPFRFLVDLGGATGHLAAAARQQYPHLRTAVLDRPAVIDQARQCVPPDVELIAGDFCIDPLPQADVFALGRILHHRSETRCRTLLDRIHKALPPEGAVLIAEMLLDEDSAGPPDVHMHSLSMLVCTGEGEERTSSTYRGWLHEAGFRNAATCATGSPLSAIFATK